MSRRTREQPVRTSRRRFLGAAAALLGGAALPGLPSARQSDRPPADIDPARSAAARRWLTSELTPSTLDPDAQMAEMQFLIRAAAPFRGQRIHVVSETIPTHVYEQRILARAFHEITGIRVQHDLIHEGELVERIQRQTRTGRNL
ncbi:twin-arginine translocation signal domain-containing protein [Thiocapsa sp.]|uniref:twin-arginine translocation signal domain-containing protein n=1 Tax=Thiocapsa sp. TaxID=2024551 RepID=UPI002B8CDF3C|nr:twin-arginine translocation signal domain-containing protein [Thiocapsa sp.]HSO83664.1 twin-arginine translocation signal domain-containing protein [Thiocapsa sp.]